jgi:hypothetical protein
LIANLFFCQDTPLRGPFNQPSNGVIDGVVLKEELPTRLTVPYQSVRAADYVWSKRLYSRIDAREKMNQPLFLPFDSFDGTTDGSFYKPTKIQEVDDYSWNKDQSRWSLWTIIFRHVLLGDLTVYKVASDAYPALEDGYSLKYPIAQKPNLNRSDYFNDQSYRKEINGIISSNGVGEYLRLPMASEPLDTFDVIKTNQAAQEYRICITEKSVTTTSINNSLFPSVGNLHSLHCSKIPCSSKKLIQLNNIVPHVFHSNHSHCMIWSLSHGILPIVLIIQFEIISTAAYSSK